MSNGKHRAAKELFPNGVLYHIVGAVQDGEIIIKVSETSDCNTADSHDSHDDGDERKEEDKRAGDTRGGWEERREKTGAG